MSLVTQFVSQTPIFVDTQVLFSRYWLVYFLDNGNRSLFEKSFFYVTAWLIGLFHGPQTLIFVNFQVLFSCHCVFSLFPCQQTPIFVNSQVLFSCHCFVSLFPCPQTPIFVDCPFRFHVGQFVCFLVNQHTSFWTPFSAIMSLVWSGGRVVQTADKYEP